ncbi:MAG: TIGR00730 family Rossman fold protein [Planctomycetes bacterium]|nr:TIGR00730 family Rossman fold protein [Planctomycetota bacterium]NOG54216.1 TIGR00730 family Rossman fold protein [Planctomycetota bacterium]
MGVIPQENTTSIRIAVYCSASTRIADSYRDAARCLGTAIASAGHELVYGGGSVGLMGEVAEAVSAAGGRVHGVITETLVALEQARQTCDELEVVQTMRQRKHLIAERAEAFIALPGGLGTYEELLETLVSRIVQEHSKPIVLVNVDRYFDPLLAMLQNGVEQRFIRSKTLSLLQVVTDPAQAVELIEREPSGTHLDFNDVIPSR